MTASRHKVLIVANQRVRDESLLPADLDRLSTIADWEWLHLEGGASFGPNEDPDAIRQLIEHVGDVDCVVVSHGSPMISAEVMDGAPNLKIIGELEGDRVPPTASMWSPPGSAASAPSITTPRFLLSSCRMGSCPDSHIPPQCGSKLP